MAKPVRQAGIAQPARRDFLRNSIQFGSATALVFGTLGSTALLTGCGKTVVPAADGYRLLRPQHITMLEKLLGVMLTDKQQQLPASQVLQNIDQFVYYTSPMNSKTILGLLDMLSTGFTRILFTRRFTSWEQLDASEVNDVLVTLQTSSAGMLRLVYRTLNSLVYMNGYYCDPDTWQGIGYPGPPKLQSSQE